MVSMHDEDRPLFDKLGLESYQFYLSIARKKHPDFDEAVLVLPAYFSKQQPDLDKYAADGFIRPAVNVSLDFGNGVSRRMVAYDDGSYLRNIVKYTFGYF